MKKTLILATTSLILILVNGPATAAEFVIVNGDSAGEGLNDTTIVAPVGGNTGTTLGEQRLIVLQAVADVWAARLVSAVPIRIHAKFDSMGNCDVLGSTGPGTAAMNFSGAPVPNVYYHSAIANAITGTDLDPAGEDFYITYNSDWDTSACPTASFYYGLDGNDPAGAEDLFPVVLHEMGHGLGFASFINSSIGVPYFGAPGIFDYYIYDLTEKLHWSEMNGLQRRNSAINTMNLTWDGPNATAEAGDAVFWGRLEVGVTAPAGIAGDYEASRSAFGGTSPVAISGEFELANTGDPSTPNDGCLALIGFTPGNVALIDRGQCEFGVKALNAEIAGASAVIVMNNDSENPDDLNVFMQAGVSGDQVTIPAIFVSYNTGNTLKGAVPGVQGSVGPWFPLLYAPSTVQPGSSVSHWDSETTPDLLMEPFTSPDIFDELDITPAQLKDVGHTVVGTEVIFNDDFESGGTEAWSSSTP